MTIQRVLPVEYTGHVREPAVSNLGELLVLAARHAPERGVLHCASGVATSADVCTHPELLERSLRLLSALREFGAEPGRAVILMLERAEDFLPVAWACLLGGLPLCPLVPVHNDPNRWAAQLRQVSTLLNGPLTLTTARIGEDLPTVHGLDLINLEQLTPCGAAAVKAVARHVPRPRDVALLMTTSGSTGGPKVVELTHANLLASMAAKADLLALTNTDVTLNWIPFDHVAAWEGHLLPLLAGARQVQARADQVLDDPLHLLRMVDAYRVTTTFAPNFLLGLINRRLEQRPGALALDLTCLRRLVSGGEANPVATGTEFLDGLARYGLDHGALWPAFGMTETCAGSIFNRQFPSGDAGAEFAAVGHPVPGLRIRVVAEETGAPLPDGRVGGVQLSGPMITLRYHNDRAATAAAFTEDGWFRTGDLGRLDRGRLSLVGRSKDSIIVNGANYHSHDLETRLDGIDGIEKGFVAAFPTRQPGSDTEQLVVAFASTLRPGDDAAMHRLLVTIRNTTVLHWGFRPAQLLPLPTSSFPKTSLGKIQRSLLRQRLEGGHYARQQADTAALTIRQLGGHTPARGPTESTLVGLYATLFDNDPATISTTASFLDLGGTSLDILRLKRLVTQHFPGTDMPVLALLTAPTVRALARHIDSHRPGQSAPYQPVVPLQTNGTRTPLFCVHPGVGEVLVFVNLAKYFTHERPFYALRARGFNPGEQTFQSFAEMARTYADAIRARQPHGPYALAGYSFGAAVAFEIAKLLEAQGEHVAFLGNLNLPPHIKQRMNELDFVDTAVNLAMFLDLIPEWQAATLPGLLRSLPQTEQVAHLIESAPPARLAELGLDSRTFTDWADLACGLTRLGRTYEPTGTVRSMTIFCAEPLHGTRHDWRENHLRHWDRYTTEPNRYVDVPGAHYTLMGPAHVPAFQAILRAELDYALSGN